MADIKALVDSGATDNFIHPNFVKRMGLGQRELDKPKNIYNIDDTTNKSGQITHYLSLASYYGRKDAGNEVSDHRHRTRGCPPWISLAINIRAALQLEARHHR
jgi:hypothetical protein